MKRYFSKQERATGRHFKHESSVNLRKTKVESETANVGRTTDRVIGTVVDRAIGSLMRLETQRRRKRLLKVIIAIMIAMSLIVSVDQVLRLAGIDLIDRLITQIQTKFVNWFPLTHWPTKTTITAV